MANHAAVTLLFLLTLQYAAGDFEQIEIFRDDFKKCTKSNCKNGGIRTDTWSTAIGDGSDEGLEIGLAGLWGNNEEQCYFESPEVVQVVNDPDDASDGILAIRALNEGKIVSCPNSQPGQPSNAKFKSARLHTRGKRSFVFDQKSGSIFIEARMKLPDPSAGLWAAFWMLAEPSNRCGEGNACTNKYGAWPASGEIDIMEAINDMTETYNALHVAGDASGKTNRNITRATTLNNRGGWHVYGVEWGPNSLRYYRDKKTLFEVKKEDWNSPFYTTGSGSAPFDQRFYIILNVAVGGRLPGPAGTKAGSGTGVLRVDYVRVYYETDKVVSPKSSPPLTGGQLALIVIGGLVVVIVAAVIANSLWKNVVTLQRADNFSMLRDPALTDEHGQLKKRGWLG